MGAMQNNVDDTGKRGSKRGSVNNSRRLDAFGKKSEGVAVGWSLCHSELLQGVIHGITKLGGAVTFGLSRDGGAHMLTLLLDDSRETLWFNGDANLDDELGDVIAKLEGM